MLIEALIQGQVDVTLSGALSSQITSLTTLRSSPLITPSDYAVAASPGSSVSTPESLSLIFPLTLCRQRDIKHTCDYFLKLRKE